MRYIIQSLTGLVLLLALMMATSCRVTPLQLTTPVVLSPMPSVLPSALGDSITASPVVSSTLEPSPPPMPGPATPIASLTPLTPSEKTISSHLLQEWKLPAQCNIQVSPDWKYAVFLCSDESATGSLPDVYLAKSWSQPEEWSVISHNVQAGTKKCAWSPDSTRFLLGDSYGKAVSLFRLSELYAPVQLIDDWMGHEYWSPDSQHIAILAGRPDELFIFSRDGELELSLNSQEAIIQPKEPLPGSIQWLSNGHQFLMFHQEGDLVSVLLTDVNTKESERLLDDQSISLFRPGLSPDKLHLVFTPLLKGNNSHRLDLETGELTSIPYDLGKYVTWSRDNQQLFGFERSGEKRVQLHVYDTETGQARKFLLPVETYDGTEIYFDYFEMLNDVLYYHLHSAAPEEQYALMRYNFATGESTVLVPSFPGWKWKVIDRHENQWLIRLWQEGEHWKVLKQKLLLVSVEDENLLTP